MDSGSKGVTLLELVILVFVFVLVGLAVRGFASPVKYFFYDVQVQGMTDRVHRYAHEFQKEQRWLPSPGILRRFAETSLSHNPYTGKPMTIHWVALRDTLPADSIGSGDCVLAFGRDTIAVMREFERGKKREQWPCVVDIWMLSGVVRDGRVVARYVDADTIGWLTADGAN